MNKKEELELQKRKFLLSTSLKKDALLKVKKITQNIENNIPVSYGSYEEGMLFIIEELDDILLNWEK